MSSKAQSGDSFETLTTTISSGQSQSGEIDVRGQALFGVRTPSGFAGSAITFQMHDGDGNWFDIYEKDGTQFELTAAASRHIIVPCADFPGAVKLRLITDVSPGSDEVLKVYTRKLS